MSHFRHLLARYSAGELSRRQLLAQASAAGVGAAGLMAMMQSPAFARQATPAVDAAVPSGRPDGGTADQARGEGGELRILVPQGASGLSAHNATGGKDIAASMIISEPLLAYGADTSLVPILVREVPTIENGLLAADLSTVTFNLLEGVTWSDGEPFTADDVVFTWEWNVDSANGSIDSVSWQMLSSVEAVDEHTVVATFAAPTIGWFQPFGSNIGAIYPRHFWEGKDAAEANQAFLMSPIGTGPYVLEELSPNDQVIYALNENYREPNKPYFNRVILKGGGDAASALTAVTKTGDWDLAFTLQIDKQAQEANLGDKGAVYGPPGTGVEKIQFNFSDPNVEVDGQRSQKDTPHPFLTDAVTREAISLAIDRDLIAAQLYGGPPSEPAGRNLLAGMAIYESPNTTWEFNPEKAAQILDDAGYILNGKVREKDGVPLKLRYTTTTAPVRKRVQEVVKASLADIGFDVELVQVDGSIFFDATNEQNFTHFYSDMQQYTDGATSAFPINYMKYWYAGPEGENIAQLENNYTGTNKTRYSNADYDALWEQIAAVATEQEAIDLFIAMNDHVVENFVEIPVVQLVADRFAASSEINVDNIAVTAFGDTFWNIANWNRLPLE